MRLFTEDSPSYRVMFFAVYCGVVLYRDLKFISRQENVRSIQATVKNLVKEEYLEDGYVMVGGSRHRVLIPSEKALKELCGRNFFFCGDSKARTSALSSPIRREFKRPRSERTLKNKTAREMTSDIYRVLHASETAMFLCSAYRAGGGQGSTMYITPDYKPDIFPDSDDYRKTEMGTATRFYYYPSMEAKGALTPDARKTATSRSTGCIASGSGNWMVYAMPNKTIRVNRQAEVRTRTFLENMLLRTTGRAISANVVLSRGMSLFVPLLTSRYNGLEAAGSNTIPYAVYTLSGEPPTYYIPMCREGAEILSMMMQPGGLDTLSRLLAADNASEPRDLYCDYMQDGLYTLSFFVPDMQKLKLFLNSAFLYPERGFRIYTYETYGRPLYNILQRYENVTLYVCSVEEAKSKFWSKLAGAGREVKYG